MSQHQKQEKIKDSGRNIDDLSKLEARAQLQREVEVEGDTAGGLGEEFVSFHKAKEVDSSSSSSSDGQPVYWEETESTSSGSAEKSASRKRKRHQKEEDDDNDGTEGEEQSTSSDSDKVEEGGTVPLQRRWQVHSCVFEHHSILGYANHTLLALSEKISLSGPCVLVAVVGEVSVDGYLLRCQSVHLSEKKIMVGCNSIPRLSKNAPNIIDHTKSSKDHEVELLYGKVDWGWVNKRVKEWQERAKTLPSIILILEPGNVEQASKGPKCIARQPVPVLESQVRAVFGSLVKSESVAVLGAPNTGKSTLCRQIANGFLSRRGRCFWIDFDLGQPEFYVPGTISLWQLTSPFFSNDFHTNKTCLAAHYLGGPRYDCPIIASHAIASLCQKLIKVQQHEALEGGKVTPLIINTHGWVLSIGRRATLEALRRLNVESVVYLRREEDEIWLTADLIANVSAGLNGNAFPKRFQLTDAPALQESCGTAQQHKKKKGMNAGDDVEEKNSRRVLHDIVISRRGSRSKNAPLQREMMWRRYFHHRSGQNNPIITVSVGLQAVSIFCFEKPVNLVAALWSSVIGLAFVPNAKLGQLCVLGEESVLDVPLLIGFGVVVCSTENEIAEAQLLKMACPLTIELLQQVNVIMLPAVETKRKIK